VGQWLEAKHGAKSRRKWRKLHLAVDAASGMIVAQTLTDQDADSTSTAYWQGWNRLRATMGGKLHTLFDAVSRVMTQTPRSNSLVENLNSRLSRSSRTCRPP
jgi:hypothetical protein